MTAAQALRDRIVGGPDSLAGRRRARRWEWLRSHFPDLDSMSVLDLGGTAESWQRAPVRPAHVHVVNLEPEPDDLPTWIRSTQADACDLPTAVRSGSYDLVYSNAVIEHVGGYYRRMRFAEVTCALAPQHWVQTPYRYFPVEPHWLCPGFQFLPLSSRAWVAQWWPLSHVRSASREDGLRGALSVELLSRAEMSLLFADSVILAERALGLVKSLIAVRAQGLAQPAAGPVGAATIGGIT